ncbi:MAG: hypothetical protein ACXU9O_07040 [Gemmatimonadaceae bacterium]
MDLLKTTCRVLSAERRWTATGELFGAREPAQGFAIMDAASIE